MKSAWHLEWEFQMQYAAPFRAHLSMVTQAFKKFKPVIVQMSATITETTKRLEELGRHIKE